MTTSNKTQTFPGSDDAVLAQRAAASHVATAELLQIMLLGLPAEKHQALDYMLASGGRVGVESTVDKTGLTSLCMVAFTGDGERLVLSTVNTDGAGNVHH